MVNKESIINRVKRHIGEPIDSDGRFSQEDMEMMFYTSLHNFFIYSNVILKTEVYQEKRLIGLNKVYLITDCAGYRITNARYKIQGNIITLSYPLHAIIYYKYTGNFSEEHFKETMKFTEGIDHMGETSIFYFFLTEIEILDKNDPTLFWRKAIDCATKCKNDTIKL